MSLQGRKAALLRRRSSFVGLAEALFGGRWRSYCRRRLLFPAGRALTVSFFHALESAALLLIFDPRFLAPIVTVRVVSSLVGASIWGATEALRRDVRNLADSPLLIVRRIEQAMARSWGLASALVGLSVLGALRHPFLGPRTFSVLDAYVIAVAIRVGISLVARTYHSGIYAWRRVYRPRWSMLIPDVVDGLGLFIFWRWVGPWSIVLALVASIFIHAALSVSYSHRAYGDVLHERPRFCPMRQLRPPGMGLCMRWIALVLLGTASEIPSLFVLAKWSRMQSESRSMMDLIYYWLRPLASFLTGLSRLFYVDFVKAIRFGRLASIRLRRRVLMLVTTVGALCVAVAALVSATNGLWSGLLEAVMVMVGAALAAALNVYVLCVMIGKSASRKPGCDLSLGAWVREVMTSGRGCRVCLLKIGFLETRKTARTLARLINESGDMLASRLGKRYLVCASPTQKPWDDVRHAADGVASVLVETQWFQIGSDALAKLAQSKACPANFRAAINQLDDPSSLEKTIGALVPNATVIRAENTAKYPAPVGTLGELSNIAESFNGPWTPKIRPWGDNRHVLPIHKQGTLVSFVVLPNDVEEELAAKIRLLTWSRSVAGAK